MTKADVRRSGDDPTDPLGIDPQPICGECLYEGNALRLR